MIDENKLANAAMSDDELDKVAGGTENEMANDSRFLNSLNGSCDRYGATRLVFENHVEEIEKAWATVGIKAYMRSYALSDNEYYLDGKQITQEEARRHAMNVTGHYMIESDWKW